MELELAEIDYLRSIAQRLREAKHGKKGDIITEASQFLNISKAELYRRLETIGYTTERKTRSDKGKSVITEDHAKLVGGMIHIATRANGKQTLSIKDTLAILREQGLAPQVSPTTIGRALRQYQYHPEQLRTPKAHVQQRSLHPNHVWQIDASVCVLFYLPKGGLQVMEEKEFYKNKPANLKKVENQRVIRYVITDHYSGNIYLEYVSGAEDSKNLIQCFLNAIQHRSYQDPMHGVPHILMMDKGSANLSGYFLNLLERLHVTYITHAAGNPRAKGQVECAQNIVERKFEGRLSFIKVNNIDELNEYATRWRLAFNQEFVHTRTKQTRNQLWQTISGAELRIAPSPDICRDLVTTMPTTITVKGDLTITHTVKGHGNKSYDVRHIEGVYPKAKLEVVVNPYRAPDIDILLKDNNGNSYSITVSPRQLNSAGFAIDAPVINQRMDSTPDSQTDTNRKAILKAAYNADTEAQVDAARKAKQAAYQGQVNAMADIDNTQILQNLPRAGQQLITEQTRRELAPINHVEAAKQIKALLSAQGFAELWTAQSYQALVKAHPQNVPVDAVRQIADSMISQHQTQQKTPHLRVINQ